jgi:hypothetical protein
MHSVMFSPPSSSHIVSKIINRQELKNVTFSSEAIKVSVHTHYSKDNNFVLPVLKIVLTIYLKPVSFHIVLSNTSNITS